MEDYSKYLSYDNGKGILLNKYDKEVLDRYQISYQECSSTKSLIIIITDYLENVLEHLEENYYYNEVKK